MKIKFYVSKDSGGTTISLHNENDEEKDTCLMMTVSTDLGGDAEINILNNEGNCISDNGLFKLSGTHILTIAIDFIKSIKSKYNVKRITLSDHATKLCGNQKLKLSILCTLLYGHTWYGKHGFRPTSKQEDKINILDVYNKNTKIARFTKVPAIKTLRKYIDDFYHHKKMFGTEEHNNMIKIYNMHVLSYIGGYIKYLLNNEHCEFVKYIYEKIFHDIGCVDTTDRLFYLDV